MLRGIGRTEGRTGVLVFVSLAERYARIVADEAIAQRVAQADWQGAIDALIDHMREGRIADGFVEAIERCGGVLATHFPAQAGRAQRAAGQDLPDLTSANAASARRPSDRCMSASLWCDKTQIHSRQPIDYQARASAAPDALPSLSLQ